MLTPQIREYAVSEIRQEMELLRKSYQLVRLVDAVECRELTIDGHQKLHYGDECHDIWNSNERCADCSSFQASQTRTVRYKTEYYQNKRYDITSTPLYLRMENQELLPCVMETIRIRELSGEDEIPDTVKADPEYNRTHDTLTGLYNQEEAFHLIRQKLLENPDKRYLLVNGNIREFHMVNLLFGYGTGNAVLEGVANLMKEHYGDDEICAHIRADRFILFIEKERFHQDLVLQHLTALQSLIKSPVYTLKIHLAVYEILDADLPLATMLQRTEIALSTIRSIQKPAVVWYSRKLMERQAEDQWIISEFQKSLMTDQFQVYYQPQVNMSGKILGAEALVRWIRGDGVMVPLDRFLPVLAQSDLITRMDEHVWEMVVMQLAEWKGTPFENLYLSINIEPRDFRYINVPEKLSALCRRYGIPIRNLHVEITERAFSEDETLLDHLVPSLQAQGFIVEIDDFGKGSSSLARLKDIPADVLKIDMGFLRESERNVRSKIILEEVVHMAGRLDTEVIVEGVETDAQKQNLEDMGCRMYQGFLFSRPVPVEVFEQLYLENL